MALASQSEQLAVTPEPSLLKEKRQSHHSRSRDHEMGQSQDEQEQHGGKKISKSLDHTVHERKNLFEPH